jgi:hypothetical protein
VGRGKREEGRGKRGERVGDRREEASRGIGMGRVRRPHTVQAQDQQNMPPAPRGLNSGCGPVTARTFQHQSRLLQHKGQLDGEAAPGELALVAPTLVGHIVDHGLCAGQRKMGLGLHYLPTETKLQS